MFPGNSRKAIDEFLNQKSKIKNQNFFSGLGSAIKGVFQ